MRRNDTIITLKIPSVLKSKLVVEAKRKGITLSELVRLRVNNAQRYNGEEVLAITLEGNDYLTLNLKRCPRCRGLFTPKYMSQLYCCNMCGCKKPCNCGAADRQRLLIT